jgi:anti-anti-sigma factor
VDIDVTVRAEEVIVTPLHNVVGYWAEQLLDRVRALVAESQTRITVDLEYVDLVDSKGLAVLMLCDQDLRQHGGTFRILTGRPELRQLFKTAHLDDRLTIAAHR